ncbi:MAG TPA: PA14 domain-containing protein [Bacteroidales bacterium]|nr:PA14 domain-containing protein [Bacteroidales bacterium]
MLSDYYSSSKSRSQNEYKYYYVLIVLFLFSGQTIRAANNIFSPEKSINYSEMLDLSDARIIILQKGKKLENAAKMLQDEILFRTRISLPVSDRPVTKQLNCIFIGTESDFSHADVDLPVGMEIPKKADGYSIWVKTSNTEGNSIYCVGNDERGALYAVGNLLRLLYMDRDKLLLNKKIQISSAPRYSLRGHQMGYRAKTNAYDAWTIEMWEQYFRDMIVFGMNSVELVPPKTDDHFDSPHFPLPPMEMMIKMSQLADDYGLDVWIWYPGVEGDFSDSLTMDYAIRERDKVLSQLPRVDAVFVPSGDPSEIHPDELFPLMKNMKDVLNKYHPDATIWSSIQNYDDKPKTMGWTNAFFEKLRSGEADWLEGVVFGPATEITIREMRERLPERFLIRQYPDITHSRNSQYEVPDWDPAYKRTEGREVINPRPQAYAKIFKDIQQYSLGFISYSEGCNDDVNKVVWSSLGWNPDTPVEEILSEYARYFIGPNYEKAFSKGISMLEENWQGPLKSNAGIYSTLEYFQEMEKSATPHDKLNWRFQQALYRAYYDAYVKARLEYESDLEEKAISILRNAKSLGSLEALKQAQEILDMCHISIKPEWRSRIFELGEALFQSIRMQLSVPKYQAKEVGRGANLDLIDVPLNNSRRLNEMFAEIKKLNNESERLSYIGKITAGVYQEINYNWEDIVEEKLKEKNLLWSINRSAEDMEHGPVTRLEFKPGDESYPGLIGFKNNKPDFENPSTLDTLKSVNQTWGNKPYGWVGYWNGYIEAPYTGQVTFDAESDNMICLDINETLLIDGFGRESERSGRIYMERGKIYPIRIWYYSNNNLSFLKLYWSWGNFSKKIINPSALFYGQENINHIKNYID